jgi:hypothetical protein
MPNLILTEVGWQGRVRNKLGVDEAYLPDADIAQPDIIGVAEANVIEQVPGYTELTGSNRTWLEAAVVCECAALLCPSMGARLPTRQVGPHEEHWLTVNWDAKRKELEAERDDYIAKITDLVVVPHFGLSQ